MCMTHTTQPPCTHTSCPCTHSAPTHAAIQRSPCAHTVSAHTRCPYTRTAIRCSPYIHIHTAPLHLLLSFPQCIQNQCTPKRVPSSCSPNHSCTPLHTNPGAPLLQPSLLQMCCASPSAAGDRVTLTPVPGGRSAEPWGSVLGTDGSTVLQQQELTARGGRHAGLQQPMVSPVGLK